jgi:hypothetical protein
MIQAESFMHKYFLFWLLSHQFGNNMHYAMSQHGSKSKPMQYKIYALLL